MYLKVIGKLKLRFFALIFTLPNMLDVRVKSLVKENLIKLVYFLYNRNFFFFFFFCHLENKL